MLATLLLTAVLGQSLTVPTTITPDNWYTIGVEGLTETQFDKAEVHCYPATAEIIVARERVTNDPILLFKPTAANNYWLYVVYPNGEEVGHIGTELGAGTGPNPVPPAPDLPLQVMLFYNSDLDRNPPKETSAILNGLKFREDLAKAGHEFKGSFDIGSVSQKKTCTGRECFYTSTLPEDVNKNWKPWIGNNPLPCAVLWDGKSDTKTVLTLEALNEKVQH